MGQFCGCTIYNSQLVNVPPPPQNSSLEFHSSKNDIINIIIIDRMNERTKWKWKRNKTGPIMVMTKRSSIIELTNGINGQFKMQCREANRHHWLLPFWTVVGINQLANLGNVQHWHLMMMVMAILSASIILAHFSIRHDCFSTPRTKKMRIDKTPFVQSNERMMVAFNGRELNEQNETNDDKLILMIWANRPIYTYIRTYQNPKHI